MNKLTHIFSTIAIACLLSGAMLTQLTAQEQTTPEGQPDPKDCGPYKDIMKIINDFGEKPFAQFQGMIQIGGDKMIVGKSLMYVNATTLTWSVVTEVASSGLCITATGKNFAPYIPTNVDNPSQPETDL